MFYHLTISFVTAITEAAEEGGLSFESPCTSRYSITKYIRKLVIESNFFFHAHSQILDKYNQDAMNENPALPYTFKYQLYIHYILLTN